MSIGYDVADLLAEIKAKNEELARLAPNNFTELEIKLVLGTMREAQSPEAASVLQKLQGTLDRLETERDAAAEGRYQERIRVRRSIDIDFAEARAKQPKP